ncbi:MAG: hypothetical protein ACLUSP_08185 [Christensenellales bacterium]
MRATDSENFCGRNAARDFGGALEKLTSPPDEKIVRRCAKFSTDVSKFRIRYLKKRHRYRYRSRRTSPVYAENADCERAIRKGNAYHKAMELIDFSANFEDEWQRLSEIVRLWRS